MHTLGPVSSSAAAQPCPRVDVASLLRLSPDQAEGVDEWETQRQRRTAQPRAVGVSREQPPVLAGPPFCRCSSAEGVTPRFSPSAELALVTLGL